ncbi:MAG TPA: DUF1349 domain-containing protein [Symbiobacteriaceae bacterium]|nr:DUF1349 domain-containing protein [Symbiobacteriaceae bacterium]
MTQVLVSEVFTGIQLNPALSWWNPPAQWAPTPTGGLKLYPDARTDFWRTTHYGYDTDNGHCLFAEIAGDFVLTTGVQLHPQHRYDQAGLMIRLSADCWIKASVEFEPGGPAMLGTVVTNHGYSDWSSQNLTADEIRLELRIRREGPDYFMEHRRSPYEPWTLMRLAHLFADDGQSAVKCGLYACSPIEAGCDAQFDYIRIQAGRIPTTP